MRLLTASRLRSARACQRLHHIQYHLGVRPVREEDTLRFGTLVHHGLEAWWTLTQMGIARMERLERTIARIREDEADPFDLVRAEATLTAYDARWANEPFNVLAVEAEFETALVNPATGAPSRTWRLAGKIDAIVQDLRDGLVKTVEHKTTSEDASPGSEYWRRLRMDSQVSVYFDGARALGHDAAACLYDVLGKPGLKPLKATPVESRKYTKDGKLYAAQRDRDETPEEYRARLVEAISGAPDRYLARGEVVRLDAELAEHRFDLWQIAQQLREAELADRFPRNPDGCLRYGRVCPYFSVCSGEASLEDPALFTRSTNVHPELEEVASASPT